MEKAGLEISNSETVTREKRPPHFEVISLIGTQP
jgi:ArsR family transcriptional regulator